ncbi:MAG: bifunctional tRNA (5-methylaminomethyl-2-thiouridine)(34)-methyltransferase MnmD/FAD-dependent 5-carboxymethylaminomethyl-2-thiouridine(34) oxidoreductase MnmC [Alcanivorax sp.]|uniref:bifunctional tRNA (5-methylaminomethyl-2-thiouridine)(34)-methyltransferase MnmD/FAD-dependent 5-carboxymethylaminomethyl-2-thiouridine(34) oxidoreductase MnmC n=1 Tax=Alloalcanivorax marinus TaxID=1177169 RepID=UPI00195B09D8|nr:bifunctional tRNA (5-methylaminomethyl-2-thiouridine)(34)-methyltransferase MnmD/FAD-dependent 5-carboxymethylaminomethyl-2-thiouridine(34) oxidoreductase MnmC [Alloalcanivorax marinus]MBM7334802.1 bifunctional tRNA (5-methylaminomethyl-2-thiouridine)(34)-methyltransferase MnmD/FAD-dependent 5-carboxymethylaminomethyl-2-thiouridine(34) oxidoreductase MnmC [Alloalcanivorax marinus]
MSIGDFAPIRPARLHWQDRTPVATDYDDPYFSRQDGRAESHYVFLDGNRLPERFAALTDGDLFVIGETGFGTGLNMLLAADLFLARAPAGARLDLFSVEKHPLGGDDLARALAAWPAPDGESRWAALCDALRDQYPPASPGCHRLWLADNVSLTLMLGEAEPLWRLCPARVDAWFLDGFAPARNADMWQPALFRALAAHSRPGATLATFTAAGAVRRGLQEAGFRVRRIDGFGHKRHMVVGERSEAGDPPWRPATLRRGTALVAGAGLAGATSARALAERGWQVTVLDPAGIARGASGNRAGVVYSTPSPHLTAQNRFYQLSYGHALRWLRRYRFPGHGQGALNGVVQHYVDDKQSAKIRAAADSGAWPDTLLVAGEHSAELRGGGYLNPPAWCAALLDHPAITVERRTLGGLRPGTPAVAVLDDGSERTADAIVIATAGAARDLEVSGRELGDLPLKRIRGQVSYCRATAASAAWERARCHGGYLTPALDGLHCVGATFDLHDGDPAPRDDDDRANLAQLRQYLPDRWAELGGDAIQVVERRVGFRCQSTDFLPLTGPLPDPDGDGSTALPGLWLNIAHGSRGLTGTPLCAEILADRISDAPPPADGPLLEALDPGRFLRRKKKKLKVET